MLVSPGVLASYRIGFNVCTVLLLSVSDSAAVPYVVCSFSLAEQTAPEEVN